jgi:hypothetical protein
MLAMRLHALGSAGDIQPLTNYPEPLTDMLKIIPAIPSSTGASQPLIDYSGRLTATQKLIMKGFILNQSPPPGLKSIQN